MEIVSDYPLWFLLFCALLGIVFAVALYHRDHNLAVKPWMRRILALFRFAAISIIAFLLMGPLVKQTFQHIEKPIIVFAQDNSSSILLGEDSMFMKNEFFNSLKTIKEEEKDNFEFLMYAFDDDVTEAGQFSFNGQQTNISALIRNVEQRFSHKNLGALIIASDGIYNTGMNPVYTARNLSFPIYTLGLGDTSVRKDLLIDNVDHNNIAFQNNEFPVEVVVRAEKCKGEKSKVSILSEDQLLVSKTFRVDNNNFTKTFNFSLKADKPGVMHYQVMVDDVEDEFIKENNRFDFFIDIIDDKQKILILARAPHPDVGAIKSAIRSNVNYSLESYLIKEFNKNIEEYNLLILHQLPAVDVASKLLMNELNNANIPVLFIIGNKTDLNSFNRSGPGLKIFGDNKTYENVYPHLNQAFTLFSLPPDVIRTIDRFPPLFAPLGTYDIVNASQMLFFQQIGSVETDNPLIGFMSTLENKFGAIVGEGIWRWRISDFEINGSHHVFNEIIRKLVQYLTLKTDKSFFHVETKYKFFENQNVEIVAELYNKNYELVNTPEVNIMITDSEGNQYPFVFGRKDNRYVLDAGSFAVGQYEYQASTDFGGNAYTDKGRFIIKDLKVEANQSKADFNLLYRLAEENNGKLLYKSQLDSIPEIIRAREDIRPTVFYNKRYADILNIFTVLLVIIALLAVEWFIRRWSGTY